MNKVVGVEGLAAVTSLFASSERMAIKFADRDRLVTSASTTSELLQEPGYSGIGAVQKCHSAKLESGSNKL